MEELDWSKVTKRCRGRLPHWEIPGMTVFVTFRLWDSLPAEVVRAYAEERKILERKIAQEGSTKELVKLARLLFSERIESALDVGAGGCLLRRAEYSELVMGAVKFFDGERYVLHALCVMPNHVHVVATLSLTERLSKTTHSWKSFVVNRAQRELGHRGSLWQEESYDHIVRDNEDFDRVVRYTLENPEKANLKNWPFIYQGLD